MQCPNCHSDFRSLTAISDPLQRPNGPQPGDRAFCVCGVLLVFDDDLDPRMATGAEFNETRADIEAAQRPL